MFPLMRLSQQIGDNMIHVRHHPNKLSARDTASRTTVTFWDNGEVDIENHTSVYLTEQLVAALLKTKLHQGHEHEGQDECPACL